MLNIADLTCGYGRGTAPVLRNLSLSFRPNVMTALVGPNGCGKSTLLKAIMGFLTPEAGHAQLSGRPIGQFKRKELAKHIAYLPQENYCPEYLTVGELVELGGFARQSLLGGSTAADRARFEEILRLVDLGEKSHLPVNQLSGGQQQRAWIAMILAQDAEIILLDEPVNHLDIRFQYSVMDLARRLMLSQGKTVIAVLHDINLASMYADDMVILKDGQLVAQGACDAVVTPENIKTAFEFDARMLPLDDRQICVPDIAAPQAAE